MLLVAFTALALSVSSTVAIPYTNQARRCGSILSSAEVEAAELHFTSNKVSLPTSGTFAMNIPVHWHVIKAGKLPDQGNITDSKIAESIKVLNKDYAKTGIRFTLAGTQRITNATWFNRIYLRSPEQLTMKIKLRKGDAATLNIYSVGFVDVPEDFKGMLGFSRFPSSYSESPKDDGIVISYTTLPGSAYPPFNMGRTLTHEVGHWVGLYHTFRGGCTGAGDYVNDTPPEDNSPASLTVGCPSGKNTCPGGGPDPIHNFMDYSDDACMTEFTPGQIARMREQMMTYRRAGNTAST
ncbi:unnamed protein product [Rhizoctonia solani]|uniref:Peptidase M43 pregnancy-associated plasma-A domain-containing protein n=1 Tax=Rhizoctonia solani TaxID=456999 RepID=A0A8H3DXM3_9AGAM|nr:unnamed protein product [Rhizoctonia solani]